MSSHRSERGIGWRRLIGVVAALVVAVTGGIVVPGQTPQAEAAAPGPKDTTAVLFSYTWNQIAEECTNTLGPAGYGYVQTSPPQEHVLGSEWWTYYQPVSYQLESRMGTEAEFRNMVSTCNDAGVEVIVDAVINHMSGKSEGGTGWAGSSFQHYNYPGLYSDSDFHGCRRDINDYGNRWEVQNCNLVNLSDLDTGSEYVRSTIAGYLNNLVDMGVAGFRFDAVKHISSEDMWGIWNKVENKDSLYVVQEVIRANEPIQPEEYIGIGDIHEFAYARKLKEAFNGGNIGWLVSGAGIGSTWDGFLGNSDAAVFVDNHDTERNGETLSYKDGSTYDLAQIFTLAWDYGSPSIHSGYEFSDKDRGPALDGSGRVVDPKPGQNGWTFKHAQNDIVNMVGFRNETYGAEVSNKWTSSDGTAVSFDRGDKGSIAINNGHGDLEREFTTSLPDGDYYNVISATRDGAAWEGETITVSGGKFTARVPAKSAVALHTGARTDGEQTCEDTSAPSTPGDVTVTASGTAAALGWGASSHPCGISAYEAERTGGTTGTVSLTAAGTSLTDAGLEPLTTYTYKVRAVSKNQGAPASEWSEAVSATTDEQSAGTTVHFQAPTGWSSAYLHYRVGSGAWTQAPGVAMSAAGFDNWYSVELDVAEGESITAVFNNGSGTWDNNSGSDYTIAAGGDVSVASGKVTAGKPVKTELLDGELTLFYKPASGWNTAHVHYRVGSGSWTSVPGVEMTRVASCEAGEGWYSTTIDTGTAASVTAAFNNGAGSWDNNGSQDYTFTTSTAAVSDGVVSTTNPCGESPVVTELDTPANLAATSVGATSVTLRWDAVENAEHHVVAVTDIAAQTTSYRSGTADNSLVVSGLQPETAYSFAVRAGTADDSVQSEYSDAVSVTTDEAGPLDVPTNLVATATSATALRVSWDTVDGAAGYRVTWADGDGNSGTVSTASDSITVTGLAPVTTYTITVAAVDAQGIVGAASDPVTVTTKDAVSSDGPGSEAGATTGEMLGGDPREDSIYFMMTARFYDGDESNNMGGSQHVKSGNADYDDPMFRGDFSGVIEKLDYIVGLGFSAIWITPVVTNRSDYDFHGYHGWDFQRIDPRLESEGATYQELIDAAHAKGIKIYQDVVYNHSSRWGEKNLFVPTVYGVQDEEWSWYYDDHDEDRIYDPTQTDEDGSTWNGDLWSETQPEGQNCQNWATQSGWSAEGYKVYNCQWPNATSGMFPADLFHQCWIGNWEGKDSQDCWIHEDLADLNTESQQVQDYLIETYNKYIDMGVDGFRVDTAVHIPRIMWNRHFLPALQAHAVEVHGEKGKDFYVFGEVAQFVHDKWNRGSVNHSAPFYTWKERKEYSLDDVVAAAEQFAYENDMGTGNQPTSTNHALEGNSYHEPDHSQSSGMSIIDMRMHMNFSDASTAFWAGMDSDDATNDATYNAVYVDSHDYGPGKSQERYSGGTDAWTENMSLMWTFRGIPVLLYGSEIEFQAGEQIDCGPTCPLATTGRAYFGDHLEGTVVASDYGVVESASGQVAQTLQQPLVKHVQTLNQIRRAVPALQKGQYSTEGVSGNMAFKRRYTDGGVDSFVLVAVSQGATFSGIPNGTYVDAVTGDTQVVGNGTLTVSLSGQGNLRAYVLDLPGNPAPGRVGDGSPFLK